MRIRIEVYRADRCGAVMELFCRAVHAVDESVYSAAEKAQWAPLPPDYPHWCDRLAVKRPFLAFIDDRLVGFIESDPDGYIDCLYVEPEEQGKGVATALYDHIEAIALAAAIERLYVDASIIAQPFFACKGFERVRTNRVARGGEVLVNYRMQKWL